MSELFIVSEEMILAKVTEKSFKRGIDYYDWGMVETVVRRGSRLFADVLGSEEDLYHVGVSFLEGDFSASCTCPYDWGGYCKHIVAVLLTWMHDGESVAVRAPVEDMLAALDTDRLRALVLAMLETDPGLAETIDGFCHQGALAT